jgi:nitrate/nitrite-specific signal transduction histidine kinase
MHNASGLLARLSRDDIPDSMMPPLRMQAAREASRLRVAMTSRPESGSQRWSLGRVIANATSGFGHLPLEVNDLLGRHVMLPIHQAMAVQMALITVLYNVQFHARATEVTIHAEDHGDWWEVSVADDGVGFDPSAVHYGFGLRHQVVEPLRSEGLAVTVTSAPGEGTVVMMRSCPDGTSHAGWN